MAVRVAINGFGRIGRLAFRQMFRAEGFDIVAINDLTDADMLAYLLKYDTTQGRYALADKVSCTENSIIVDGTEITIYKEADAKNLPWKDLDIEPGQDEELHGARRVSDQGNSKDIPQTGERNEEEMERIKESQESSRQEGTRRRSTALR